MSCPECKLKDRKLHKQKRELQAYENRCAEKTKQLKALHFVFCSGPCGNVGGSELTKEIVDEAIRNTDRLVLAYCNSRKLPNQRDKTNVEKWNEMIKESMDRLLNIK